VGPMGGTRLAVNSRDPRVIDLSPAAFRALFGGTSQGVGRVRIIGATAGSGPRASADDDPLSTDIASTSDSPYGVELGQIAMGSDGVVSDATQGLFDGAVPFDASAMEQDMGEIAMAPAQGVRILDRLTKNSVRRNVSPQVFFDMINMADLYSENPRLIQKLINDTMANPMARLAVANPDMLEVMIENAEAIKVPGVKSSIFGDNADLAVEILKQAKAEGLLRRNVPLAEIKQKLSEPMRKAFQTWLDTWGKDKRVHALLLRSSFGKANNIGRPGGRTPEQFLRELYNR